MTSTSEWPAAQNDPAADAYGTFAAGTARYEAPELAEAKPKSYSKVWRAVGVVGALAVAGSVLLTGSSEPAPALRTTTAANAVVQQAVVQQAVVQQASVAAEQPLSSIEQQFVAGVQRPKIREYLHAYASVPHTCGTAQDYETALYTKAKFEEYGLKAEIKQYDTLLSYPVHRRLAFVNADGGSEDLNLTEASVPGDSCTTDPTALPPFLGYAASGNVTGGVVYVNFGTVEDFEWLVAHNVTLEGKIALVRYGGSMRGIKVMLAEKHGMVGTLIYSDPKEDGFVQGKVYPEGSFRPENSFQRGSISYPAVAPGDPLTPGFASVPGAPYLTYDEIKSKSVPSTPALPLSYGLARQILAKLGGAKAPTEWQGGLTFADGYHIGNENEVVLNLDLEMDNHVTAIWDVIGTVEGVEEPEKVVVIGNHRDAWVCGAVDPSSGSATMMEIARGFGELLKTGWQPRRTIQLGSWDGEEYNLIGSTEWAEDNAETLTKHAVAYLNVDLLVGPLVTASGTPSIAKFVQDTAKLVPASKFTGDEVYSSLFDQWSSQMAVMRAETGEGFAGTLAPDHLITFMGSGSDFTPFYQHLGIISVNLAFGLTYGSYGVYHSTMDSIMYMETQGDPLFASHETMVRWWGLLALRLANDRLIPFDFSSYGLVMENGLADYATELETLGLSVDLTELRGAIRQFTANANVFQAEINAFEVEHPSDAVLAKANEKLVQLERYLLSSGGLPHRPWYKHVIFGPGYYAGYAGAAFPGIGDAIAFNDDSATIQAHVDEVTTVVHGAAAYLIQ